RSSDLLLAYVCLLLAIAFYLQAIMHPLLAVIKITGHCAPITGRSLFFTGGLAPITGCLLLFTSHHAFITGRRPLYSPLCSGYWPLSLFYWRSCSNYW